MMGGEPKNEGLSHIETGPEYGRTDNRKERTGGVEYDKAHARSTDPDHKTRADSIWEG
jgi:hypothetical protein